MYIANPGNRDPTASCVHVAVVTVQRTVATVPAVTSLPVYAVPLAAVSVWGGRQRGARAGRAVTPHTASHFHRDNS